MIALGFDYLRSATILNAANIPTLNGHPIEFVQDPRLSRAAWIIPVSAQIGDLYGLSLYAENPYLALTVGDDVVIDFDVGAVVPASIFGMAGNNWKNIDITLEWSETDIENPDGTIHYQNPDPEYTVMIDMGEQLLRYLRVRVTGVEPLGNYLIIGRMSLGQLFQFPSIGTTIDVDVISDANRMFSDTRQLYGGPKTVYRRVSVTFPEVLDPPTLTRFFRTVDLYNPFYLGFDEDCLEYGENLYCTFTENSIPYNVQEGDIVTSRLSFMETF